MEEISNGIVENETYPLVIRHIPESMHTKYERHFRQADENDQKYLQELKEMLQGNKLSTDIEFEDDFLKVYLVSNNYKIDKAFSKIQNFLHLRINHSYFFHNINFDFTQNPAYRFITILPLRRMDGSVSVLCEIAKWDPEEVPFEHLKQIVFMIYMQELRNPLTQACGFNVIHDFADVGLRYLKYSTPQNVYLLNHVSFEIMPAKYVGYHIINGNFITNLLVRLSRPFLPEFVRNILHIHSSVEELFEFFPHSMLPVQYGGTLTDYYMGDWLRKANEQHTNFPAGGRKNIF
ncbi:hypothetical protein AVEN_83326-1 [Araneus ventricosus]|uniref:CRAL-TRIO domain-containing protein n=1 Tax=Araneus ventricosus TaxID=182803 RepID=A0A4Y2PSH7_ARAVE|nr:hypothetical protein AVEN_83326-1 [Araneus ventricosus]